MALRDFAVGAARLNATVWKEIVRAVDPQPGGSASPSPQAAPAQSETNPAVASDAEAVAPNHGAQEAEPGTMLVPLDTWTRILDQLGHLHLAGQELAEARERAAKAETEATFLREQLADARAQIKKAPKRAAPRSQAKLLAPDSTGPSETSAAARMQAARDAAWGSVSKARTRIRNRRAT